MNYSLLAVGPFGIFDGSIVAIFKHLPLVFGIAYGVPLALLIAVKFMVPWLDLRLLLWPFQWILSASPTQSDKQAAQIQSAVKAEVGQAMVQLQSAVKLEVGNVASALTEQLSRIESQVQPKDVSGPAVS